jgi:hypothetical protein
MKDFDEPDYIMIIKCLSMVLRRSEAMDEDNKKSFKQDLDMYQAIVKEKNDEIADLKKQLSNKI